MLAKDSIGIINKSSLFNWSTLVLILTNLSILYYFVRSNLAFDTLLWVYWFQSIIIGFFTIIKILSLKDFSTQGVKIGGEHPKATFFVKIFIAGFFTIHYGIFHLVYAMFLLVDTFFGNLFNSSQGIGADWGFILTAAGLFFINHAFSFFYHKNSDKKPNIGRIMGFPYVRIIPMHITIIAGTFLGHGISAIVFFIILKTVADVVAHVIEHKRTVASA